jgi:hypothetical protein
MAKKKSDCIEMEVIVDQFSAFYRSQQQESREMCAHILLMLWSDQRTADWGLERTLTPLRGAGRCDRVAAKCHVPS